MKKTAIAIIGLIVLLVAGYLLYGYFFYTCCALPTQSPPAISSGSSNDPVLNNPDLLYAKRARIGFCRTKSGSGGSCHFNTYLYSSGKLIVESGESAMEPDGEKRTTYPTIEKELDKNLMGQIVKQIRDSGIMNKSCEAEMVTDFYVNYFINLDGMTKEARFPGCETEFNEIDKLIDGTG